MSAGIRLAFSVQVQIEQVEEVAAVAQEHVEELRVGAAGRARRQAEGGAAQHHGDGRVGALDRPVEHPELGDVLVRGPAQVSPTLQGSLSHCQ